MIRVYYLVDLSNNNRVQSFAAIKNAGYEGVWLKVSEGATFSDPTWASYSSRARAAGLRVGGYHYAYPQRVKTDAVDEARHFCDKLGRIRRRDLRPVLDLEIDPEGLSDAELTEWARAFNREVWRLSGTLPVFYSYPYFIQTQLVTTGETIGAGLWLAAYGANDGKEYPFAVPRPWKKAVAHQFTSRGFVPGVDGRCDISSVVKLRPLLAYPVVGKILPGGGGGTPLQL